MDYSAVSYSDNMFIYNKDYDKMKINFLIDNDYFEKFNRVRPGLLNRIRYKDGEKYENNLK
jgi:hypothetical protein